MAGLCRRGSQQRLITTLFQQFNVLVRSRRGRSPCEVKGGGRALGPSNVCYAAEPLYSCRTDFAAPDVPDLDSKNRIITYRTPDQQGRIRKYTTRVLTPQISRKDDKGVIKS